MPNVIIESKSLSTNPATYSTQKTISFYTKEAAEAFAEAVNNSDQGSNPNNTVMAIVVDSNEQAVNGEVPHLLHTLYVERSSGSIQFEAVDVFTQTNLDYQRSFGLNPAIIHAFDNLDAIVPAVLTETEQKFHCLADGEQENIDVYLSFLPDIREKVQNLLATPE